MKTFWVALAILSSAISFASWLVGPLREELGVRFKHRLGWFAPEMEPEWARVAEAGRLFHDLKNITTEWTRLDEQRSSKFFSFWIVLWFLVSLALAIALALVIVL